MIPGLAVFIVLDGLFGARAAANLIYPQRRREA
jgi:hypothetical protein